MRRELLQKEEEHRAIVSSLNLKVSVIFLAKFFFLFPFHHFPSPQLQENEASQSVRHQLAVGGVISQQERAELQSSIREQETLLLGYQKVVHTHSPIE